jgi:glycosyltransferase 2 family protein
MFKHWFLRASIAGVLSALLVGALVGLGSPQQLWNTVSSVSWSAAGEWVCLYGALIYLRAARFRILLPQCEQSTLIRAIAVQGGINRIVPFRLGELSLPFLIRQRQVLPTSAVLFGLAWIRLLELSLIGVSITLGVGLHGLADGRPLMQWVALGCALIVLAVFVAIDPRRIAQRMIGGLKGYLLVLERLHARLEGVVSALIRVVDALPPLSVTDRFKLLGWSLAVHCCILYLYFSMLEVFGVTVAVGALLIGVGVSQVTSLTPMLTVGTIGLHELGWVGGFVYSGLTIELAVTSGVLTQVFTLLLGVVWAGGLYLPVRKTNATTS